jgi:hypothetical protein
MASRLSNCRVVAISTPFSKKQFGSAPEIKHDGFRIVANSGITSRPSGAPSARLLRIRQMAEATLREHQSRLLGVLTITAAQRFGVETFLIEEGGGVRRMRLACVGDVVLLDYPADATGPRSINCYLVKTLEFTAAPSGDADAKRFKVGSDRLLYSLRWKHNAPADLHLVKEPDLWFEPVANVLLEALAQHDPGLRDRLLAADA